MKRWPAYSEDLLTGDWQVHSTWSDGKNSILEYCEEARRQGLRLIAFTEHVRKKLKYDFSAYIREVEKARSLFPDLKILAGCEAKVLNPQGELDAPEVPRIDPSSVLPPGASGSPLTHAARGGALALSSSPGRARRATPRNWALSGPKKTRREQRSPQNAPIEGDIVKS